MWSIVPDPQEIDFMESGDSSKFRLFNWKKAHWFINNVLKQIHLFY